jgi:hypothetical protein
VFQWLGRWLGLVNRFIRFSLVVTAINSYILSITVTIAHVTSLTKSCNSSSGHTAVPLELRNSSEVNSHSRILSYPLDTDNAKKTQSRDNYLASQLTRWLLPSNVLWTFVQLLCHLKQEGVHRAVAYLYTLQYIKNFCMWCLSKANICW